MRILILLLIYLALLAFTIFLHIVYRRFLTDDFENARTISDLSFPKRLDYDGYNILDGMTLFPVTLPIVTVCMIFAIISKLIGTIPLTFNSRKNPLMTKFDKVDQKFR